MDKMEATMRKEARRAPVMFLYATDKRLRCSSVKSGFSCATFFIAAT